MSQLFTVARLNTQQQREAVPCELQHSDYSNLPLLSFSIQLNVFFFSLKHCSKTHEIFHHTQI